MHTTRVIAHRGASGWAPEHTETAVRLAAELGADAVEPDLVASRDGVLVVRHDNELSDTTDVATRPEFADRSRTQIIDGVALTGWFVEDFAWSELATLRTRERLPHLRPLSARRDGLDGILRFTDLLAIAEQTGLDVVAELKHASHHAAIGLPLDAMLADAVLGTRWMAGGALTVESFEETVLHEVRSRGVEARVVYLMDADGTAADLVADSHASAADRLAESPASAADLVVGSPASAAGLVAGSPASVAGVPVTYAAQRTESGLAALADRVDAISVAKSLLFERDDARLRTSDLAERARAVGLGTITWTLRPENTFLEPEHRLGAHDAAWGDWQREWSMLAGLDLEAVFADHPDLWRRVTR